MGLRMIVWFFHSPHQLVKIFFDKLKNLHFSRRLRLRQLMLKYHELI